MGHGLFDGRSTINNLSYIHIDEATKTAQLVTYLNLNCDSLLYRSNVSREIEGFLPNSRWIEDLTKLTDEEINDENTIFIVDCPEVVYKLCLGKVKPLLNIIAPNLIF